MEQNVGNLEITSLGSSGSTYRQGTCISQILVRDLRYRMNCRSFGFESSVESQIEKTEQPLNMQKPRENIVYGTYFEHLLLVNGGEPHNSRAA